MKIILINAYSYKNLGDSGIVISMINFLRKEYSDPDILVMSSNYIENEKFYADIGVSSIEPPWVINDEKSFIKKYFEGVLAFFSLLLFKNKSKKFSVFKDCDLVLSVGGGYIYSSRKGPLGVGLLNVLFNYYSAKKMGCKVIGFPQSIGPFNSKVDLAIANYVLSRMDRIYYRESLSSVVLEDDIYKFFPDFALSLTAPKKDKVSSNDFQNDIIKIGITVLDWRFAKSGSTLDDIDHYLEKLATSIAEMNKQKRVCVNVYPQVDVGGSDSDLWLSNKLNDLLGSYEVLSEVKSISSLSHELIINEYSKNDLFIASRMHSAIFATDGKVPVVALAYQPKMIGTMKIINRDEYCSDISEFTVGWMLDSIKKSVDQKSNYTYPIEDFKKDFFKVV